jgi:hypothetical protein
LDFCYRNINNTKGFRIVGYFFSKFMNNVG